MQGVVIASPLTAGRRRWRRAGARRPRMKSKAVREGRAGARARGAALARKSVRAVGPPRESTRGLIRRKGVVASADRVGKSASRLLGPRRAPGAKTHGEFIVAMVLRARERDWGESREHREHKRGNMTPWGTRGGLKGPGQGSPRCQA